VAKVAALTQNGGARADASIKLSICIPTYNFGRFIGETLQSILPQVVDGVEVVILDGGSTDDTAAIVRAFQEVCPGLRYHRRAERGGIDRDMARTVELAKGEFCWLFSSDDTMKPGAVRRVLEEVESGLDIYMGGLTLCTYDMHPLRDQPILDVPAGTTFDLGRTEDRRGYFEHAQTTTALFSFLGSMIFKKARWDAVPLDEDFVGSCWAHVARIFRLIPSGLSVKYLGQALLWKRCDNDSFLDNGLIRRFAITIDGYHSLADTFFGHGSLEALHIRRAVAAEFPPSVVLYTKWIGGAASREDRILLERLVETVYADPSLRNRLCRGLYKAMPTPFTGLAARVSRVYTAAEG
jgi:abequosyltransferase